MNSKTFRGPKLKSASSTFISLHFNKSDEDQLEISYKNDKKETEGFVNKDAFEVTQSNFYVSDAKKDIDSPFSQVGNANVKLPVSASDPTTIGILNQTLVAHSANAVSEDSLFQKAIKSPPCQFETECDSFQPKQNEDEIDFLTSPVSDSELKLSPAIEAAELIDSDNFNHYINDKLEKAKCEKLDPSLTQSAENPILPPNSGKVDETDVRGSFYSVLQNSLGLMKWAQKNVKTYLIVAVLACVCAPIPSWLSGFLVGSILSSIIVYWLYKPQKNKKHFYASVLPEIEQKESGILKGWMNELPSFMSYSPDQYHVSCTRSVYVRLEGSYLRFSFPQKNIPKRAMFNEPRYEKQFIYQQHFDITDATLHLLPHGLKKKRLWSKKYPICLRIPNHKAEVNKKDQKWMPRINENNEIVIYLFSRNDRDKSLWFSRFLMASKLNHSPTLYNRITEHKKTLSADFAYLQNNEIEGHHHNDDEDFVNLSLSKEQKFEIYMSELLLGEKKGTLTWFNALIGRLFFDFLVEDDWAQLVSEKIQKKLNRIKLPFLLAELSVKEIHLGSALPKVHNVSDPCTDERGLWIDMDVSYNGSFHMTLETKLNLDRFKAYSETFFATSSLDQNEEQTKSCAGDSDEDSLESSSEEDQTNKDSSLKEGSSASVGTSKKFLKLMDKLTQSSYFQHAAKNKYVKKAMNDLSNTPLILTVEVQWLSGTLAINIPPWPTDRLWYGFRTNPSLSITARPKLGQHVVTFTQITEWIEKKLTSEFQKVLVMPNMDDLIIPIMQDAS